MSKRERAQKGELEVERARETKPERERAALSLLLPEGLVLVAPGYLGDVSGLFDLAGGDKVLVVAAVPRPRLATHVHVEHIVVLPIWTLSLRIVRCLLSYTHTHAHTHTHPITLEL